MVSICSHLAAVRVPHAGIGAQPLGCRSVSSGRSARISLCRTQIPHSCSLKAALLPWRGSASTRWDNVSRRPSHALCLLLCLAFFLAAPLSQAAEAVKLDGLFGQWFAVQTNLQGWSADFTQTRSLKVLAQPLISTGKVWVATSRFRWELGQPPQTIALRQPDQLVIIYPRLKRAEKYPLSGVPAGPVKDAFALLDASLPRDRAAMEDRFNLLSATQTNSTLQVALQPKSASARKFISEIRIAFRTNDFSIAMTEMQFADGSSLRNDFTNVVLNPVIPPEKFEAALAPDVTVVEPLRR
jgi:outer membrane lipoprotein-sorting protein